MEIDVPGQGKIIIPPGDYYETGVTGHGSGGATTQGTGYFLQRGFAFTKAELDPVWPVQDAPGELLGIEPKLPVPKVLSKWMKETEKELK